MELLPIVIDFPHGWKAYDVCIIELMDLIAAMSKIVGFSGLKGTPRNSTLFLQAERGMMR